MTRHRRSLSLLVVLFVLLGAVSVSAIDDKSAAPEESGSKSGLAIALTAIAAGLALGLSAIATGIAQSRIGAAGVGAIAERPESVGTVILLVAIPETLVIFGFVMGIILVFAT